MKNTNEKHSTSFTGIAAIRRRARARILKQLKQSPQEKTATTTKKMKNFKSHTNGPKWSEWKIRTNEMENIVYIRPMRTGARANTYFLQLAIFSFVLKLCTEVVCAFLYSSLRLLCAGCLSLVSCFVAHFYLYQKLNNKHTHEPIDRETDTER